MINPVTVTLDVPVYYVGERGSVPSKSIFCAEAFARSVLPALQEIAQRQKWGIAHIGVYNPRKARHKDGTPITPARWSSHAYAEAMDFKGFVDQNGELLTIKELKTKYVGITAGVIRTCTIAIQGIGRRPEIVDEGDWLHIGLWPDK